jgi:hypothetical protein
VVAYCRSPKTPENGEHVTDLRGYHLARDGGSAIWMLDTLMHVKAATDDTRGAFTLIEALAPSGLVLLFTFTIARRRASTSLRAP